MATTAGPLSLPYPVLGDAPDGPGSFYALANRIQAILAQDSGWVAIAPIGATHTGEAWYRRVGATVTVTWHILRDTALGTTDNSILTIPVGYRPSKNLWSAGTQYTSGGVTKASEFSVAAATGTVTHTNVTSAINEMFSGTITYVTALPSS